jgi:hypothetical protein
MPVNEGLDLVAAAKERLDMATGVAFVNKLLPPLAAAEADRETLRALRAQPPSTAVEPYVEAAVLRLDREVVQREHARRFEEESGMPSIELFDYEALQALEDLAMERHAENPAQVPWLDMIVQALDEGRGDD